MPNLSGPTVVGVIPPGVTIDTALEAMRGMGACYPAETLSLGNDPVGGGMRIIHDPDTANTSTPPAGTAEIMLGATEPGDLLAFAFSVDDQQDGLKALAFGLISMLERAAAANYLTFAVELPDVGRYAATIQRCAGKTPAERIAELEQLLAEQRPECICPGGLPDGWKTDFEPTCPRHAPPPVTDDELHALLPAARAARFWAVGARTAVYRDDPAKTDRDGHLVNVITAVLDELRTPVEARALQATEGNAR